MREALDRYRWVVVAAAAVSAVLASITALPFIDLQVYLFGARNLVDGVDVYSAVDQRGLPFNYPPFAAAVMVPLTWIPFRLAVFFWLFATFATLAWAVRRLTSSVGIAMSPLAVLVATAGAVALEPVWSTMEFAQINVFLLGIVLIDLVPRVRDDATLRRGVPWWSGAFVGIAAGLKLTPLIFIVFLVLVGRIRAAGVAVASMVATMAVGFLVIPHQSWEYWTKTVFDDTRPGWGGYAGNQSVMGVLHRLYDEPPPRLLWFVIASVLAAAALALGAWVYRRGEWALGAGIAGLAMVLASPVSWDHHWVWVIPLLIGLWNRGQHRAAAAFSAPFFLAVIWWVPRRGGEVDWWWWQHLLGDSYVIAAVAFLAWFATVWRRER